MSSWKNNEFARIIVESRFLLLMLHEYQCISDIADMSVVKVYSPSIDIHPGQIGIKTSSAMKKTKHDFSLGLRIGQKYSTALIVTSKQGLMTRIKSKMRKEIFKFRCISVIDLGQSSRQSYGEPYLAFGKKKFFLSPNGINLSKLLALVVWNILESKCRLRNQQGIV